LHGQFPRRETAHASCMDNFLAGKRLMQVAWTISSQGNGSCKLHGQFPRRETAHASCMDNFLAGKRLMQLAFLLFNLSLPTEQISCLKISEVLG
jgi:hypothetical protein